MLEFLGDAYRPWFDILDDDNEDSQFVGPAPVQGKSSHIGFGYHFHTGPEGSYNYAVIRWMALMVGRKRKQFKEGHFIESVPYYTFWSEKGGLSLPVVAEDIRWVPETYQDFVVDRYGLIKSDRTARELAWRNIPNGTFERVSLTHAKKSPQSIKDALIQSGIERAKIILQFIRAEVSRLDSLWNY